MANNLESFVETLRTEGVDAGKQAAQKIEAEARQQADRIVSQARKEAERIVAEAKSEANKIQARMTSSLELASRDTILTLQEKLSRLLTALLSHQVEKLLSQEDTLSTLVHEVVFAYAKTSDQGELHVPEALRNRLFTGALQELAQALNRQELQIEVKASLAKAGFEYKVKGSTVEVSVESVTALLAEMIDPELRKIFANAVEQKVAIPQE